MLINTHLLFCYKVEQNMKTGNSNEKISKSVSSFEEEREGKGDYETSIFVFNDNNRLAKY